MNIFILFLLVIGGYLIGSLPAGYWLVRLLKGVDVREYGSGNIGTVNVHRVAGKQVAALVLVCDIAKGIIPVMIAKYIFLTSDTVDAQLSAQWLISIVALAPIIGHNWSIFLGGQGGKGVATTAGALFALAPFPSVFVAVVWLATVLVTRYSSLASMLGAISAPFFYLLYGQPTGYVVFGAVAALLVVWRHEANIRRLLAGQELRIDQKAEKKS